MKRSLLLCALVVLVVFPNVASAQCVSAYLSAGEQCYSDSPGLLAIPIIIVRSAPLTAVSFAAPAPACFTGVYLSDTVLPGTTGNSQTGATVPLGSCLANPNGTVVMAMNFFVDGTTGFCCGYPLAAHPQSTSGQIEITECNGNIAPAGDLISRVNGDFACCLTEATLSLAYGPGPANQATEVPLNVQLDATIDLGLGALPLSDLRLHFGTTPDPPFVQGSLTLPVTVGPLLENTTYYWSLHWSHVGGLSAGCGPTWSFTTEQTVPVRESSWGAIKALFD